MSYIVELIPTPNWWNKQDYDDDDYYNIEICKPKNLFGELWIDFKQNPSQITVVVYNG